MAAFASETDAGNPLLEEWTGPFGVPPFDRIHPTHFLPAFARAFAAHQAEIDAIAGAPAEPTFANTIDALELSGKELERISNVFRLLAGAHTNDAILKIERELAPIEAKHWNRILMDAALFARIDSLHRRREQLGLMAEEARVLERYHLKFKRRTRRRRESAARRHQRAAGRTRHRLRSERARGRAGLRARS
jgi:peptidyl-dipeptidase Dcp